MSVRVDDVEQQQQQQQPSSLDTLVAYARDTFVSVCGGTDEATRVLDVALLVVLVVGVLFLLRLALRQCSDVGAAFWSFLSTAGIKVIKIVALGLALYVLSSQALASFARISGSTPTTPLQATSEFARQAREQSVSAMKAASTSDWLVPRLLRAYMWPASSPPPLPPPPP